MNLLAFVLLGFLAHSCSGTVQISNPNFQKHVCSIINDHFIKNEGISLVSFGLDGISEVVTSATGLISLQTVITYQSNNYYQLDIQGAVKLNSLHFTGLELGVHVTGQLGLFVRKGCLNLNVIEGSLQVTLEVANNAVSVGLGGALGSLVNLVNLVNGFTSNCKLLLEAKIQEVIFTSLDSVNAVFQGITTSVQHYGNSIHYEVTAIECTLESVAVSLALIVEESANTVTKTLILSSTTITELTENLVSIVTVSGDFISDFTDYALDNIVTGIQETLTKVQMQLQNVFESTEDVVYFHAKKLSAPSCDIKSSGSSLWLTLGVGISDATGDSFLEMQVDVEVSIAATANNGFLGLSFGRTSISNSRISSKGGRFASKGDAELLGSTKYLIEYSIDNIVSDLQCALDSGIPSLAPIIPYFPFASKCSPSNNYNGFQCDCEKVE